MKTYVMIRVYKTKAPSWFLACFQFRKLAETGNLNEALVYDRVKEEKPKGGFLQTAIKQLFG
jgi:hypothetical protein